MPNQLHTHDHADLALLPRLLALDAVIHASVIEQAVNVAAEHATDVARIVDLGAGTGAGTFALATKYPHAQVTAVDTNPDMLLAVRGRAEEQQIPGRISTVLADIGVAGLDGTADLIWSSNAMHEMPDPATAFGNVFRSLRPGGVLLVVEMDTSPTVLPAEYAPLEAALRAASGADGPAPDWSGAISGAGFDLLDMRSLVSDQILPAGGPGGEYAALELRRLAQHVHPPTLASDAITELRRIVIDLTSRHEVLDHVHIRGTRTLWAARRP